MTSNATPGAAAGVAVGVFCGANPGFDERVGRVATELGRRLAETGHPLVYGGGRVGSMGTVADAVLAGGGRAIGVIPRALLDREVGHRGLTELIVTESMHARKQAMCDRVHGFIVLPGGFGTLDEALEILTWNQIGIIAKPIVFLDVPIVFVDGMAERRDDASARWYFDHFFAFLDDAVAGGFVRPDHRSMARRATAVDEAIRIATGPAPASPSKWLDPTVR